MCRILLYFLQSSQGITRSKYRNLPLQSGPEAATRCHLALFNAGLIQSNNHPNQLQFVLTPKGQAIALKLKEIEEDLKIN